LGAEATIFITGSLGDNLAFAGANLGPLWAEIRLQLVKVASATWAARREQ
jgi:hypothetical protein